MICTHCGQDVAPEHMSTTKHGMCRVCDYSETPFGAALAVLVNHRATENLNAKRRKQAKYAPFHPISQGD